MMPFIGSGLPSLGGDGGGTLLPLDVEAQTNYGGGFVPPGGGDAAKYLLRVIFTISTMAVLLNSVAILSSRLGAAAGTAAAATWVGPAGGWWSMQVLYGVLVMLVHLGLFTTALVVLILSALALHGDPASPVGGADLIRWTERHQVRLLCVAVLLLVLTFAVTGIPGVASRPPPAGGAGDHR